MRKHLLKTLHPDYEYEPVAYHDSWMSIDPIIGCQLNCKYCFLQMNRWTKTAPQTLYTCIETIDMLLANKYFLPHKSILCFGNRTDAFLPRNVDFTLKFLEELEHRKLRNPVVIVTKKRLPESVVHKLKTLTYIRFICCLSFSGLPEDVEGGVDSEDVQWNFVNLHKNNLRIVHFWRPILELNGSAEAVQRMLGFVSQYAVASVYVGLKLHPSLTDVYRACKALHVPKVLGDSFGDYIPQDVELRIRSIIETDYPDYPIYRHTSCAVSLTLSIPDYNATFSRKGICKSSNCPERQRIVCERAYKAPKYETVTGLLDRIGVPPDFAIHNDHVEIHSRITQEDYAFLLHCIGFPISAKNIVFDRLLHGSIFRKDNIYSVKSRGD